MATSTLPNKTYGGTQGYVNSQGVYVPSSINNIVSSQQNVAPGLQGANGTTIQGYPGATPISTQNPSPVNNVVSFGGQNYDLSSASGLKSYQDAVANVNQTGNTTSQVGSPSLQVPATVNPPVTNTPTSQAVTPTSQTSQTQQTQQPNLAQKYNTIASNPPPQPIDTGGGARQYMQTIAPPQQQQVQPNTDVIDAVMADYVQGIQAQNNFDVTRQTVQQYQANLAQEYQIPQTQQELMNIKTVMTGTEDDIRNEINSAGGFATESQVQGLTYTRNKALVKQATNIENQLSIAQTNMDMSLQTYQADYNQTQTAFQNRISGDANIMSLYNTMQTKATGNYDKIVSNVGYTGLVQSLLTADPTGSSVAKASQYLFGDSKVLTNQQSLNSLETYRQKSLQNSQTRITIQQQNATPLEIRRYTMAANAITSNYIKLPAYQLLANASPMLSRIEAAETIPGSVSDQDLLDSVTKLNTGGQAVTEAQVNTITGGRSYADTVNVWQKKFAQGGVLSNDQRQQLLDLSRAVYGNYQKNYQPIYNQVSKQLQNSGIPQEYWTLPDLNSLSQAAGISYMSQGATQGTPTLNNQQYYQASDGLYYPVNQ